MNKSFDQIIRVGLSENITSLHAAMSAIALDAQCVLLRLTSDISESYNVEIPENLSSMTIASDCSTTRKIDFFSSLFIANGVQLTIGKHVCLIDCLLFGGSRAGSGQVKTLANSEIMILGCVDQVFAGGFAEGSGSESTVDNASVGLVNGQASNIYGGGYAIAGGLTKITTRTQIVIDLKSVVHEDVYAGDYVVGQDSKSLIHNAEVLVNGAVTKNLFCGSTVALGGSSIINESVSLSIGSVFSGQVFLANVCDEQSSSVIQALELTLAENHQVNLSPDVIELINKTRLAEGHTTRINPSKWSHSLKIIPTILLCLILLTGLILLLSDFSKKDAGGPITPKASATLIQKTASLESAVSPVHSPTVKRIVPTKEKLVLRSATPQASPTIIRKTKTPKPTLTPAQNPTVIRITPTREMMIIRYFTQQASSTAILKTESSEVTDSPAQSPTPTKITPTSAINQAATDSPAETALLSPQKTVEAQENTGVLFAPMDIGTLLYSKSYLSNEFIMQTVLNGSQVEKLGEIVFANGFYWYNIRMESGVSGWVLAEFVVDNSDYPTDE